MVAEDVRVCTNDVLGSVHRMEDTHICSNMLCVSALRIVVTAATAAVLEMAPWAESRTFVEQLQLK